MGAQLKVRLPISPGTAFSLSPNELTWDNQGLFQCHCYCCSKHFWNSLQYFVFEQIIGFTINHRSHQSTPSYFHTYDPHWKNAALPTCAPPLLRTSSGSLSSPQARLLFSPVLGMCPAFISSSCPLSLLLTPPLGFYCPRQTVREDYTFHLLPNPFCFH